MLIRPLPEALAEKARLELNEDKKKMEHYLQHLKDWIAKQPHLKARTGELKKQIFLSYWFLVFTGLGGLCYGYIY